LSPSDAGVEITSEIVQEAAHEHLFELRSTGATWKRSVSSSFRPGEAGAFQWPDISVLHDCYADLRRNHFWLLHGRSAASTLNRTNSKTCINSTNLLASLDG